MKRLRKLIGILLCCLSGTIFAQDIHFTQFYASPLSHSPAMAGLFDGEWRVSGNYRSQWKSISDPFRTISLGYDQKIPIGKHTFTGGLYALNDVSGTTSFTVNKVFLNLGYHKQFNQNLITGGLQVGYVGKNLDLQSETFPDQWDQNIGGFNTLFDNNETNIANSINYIDANLGMSWTRNFNKITPTVAVTAFHINSPKEDFTKSGNTLPIRMSYSAQVKIKLNKKFTVIPRAFLMTTTKASDFLMGANLEYAFKRGYKKNIDLFAGTVVRDGFKSQIDAAAGILGIRFNNYTAGFSYDINISDLQTATKNKGGFEISLIYIQPKYQPKKIAISCDRL